MTYGFFWSERSEERNRLTARYEPLQPLLLLEFASRTGATAFVDVGANIGFYSLVMTLLPAIGRVVAFEAGAEACREVRKNIEMNDLGDRIVCVEKAVSASAGRIDFAIEKALSGINSVAATSIHDPRLFTEMREVESCRLDEFAELAGGRLAIKIDVEGHELSVLSGALGLLAASRCVLQVEALGKSQGAVADLLEPLGYRRLFSAGNDLYLSNDTALAAPSAVIGAVERAVGRMIDVGLGRWPKVPNRMTVEATVRDGVLSAACTPDRTVFRGALEFAFCVDAGGKRLHTGAYAASPSFELRLPAEQADGRIALSAFVRERAMPEKKLRVIVNVAATR